MKPSRTRSSDVCPCGGMPAGASFAECCGPLVRDGALATTPEALMRSRYTAFALGDADHLWRTWHPNTRPVKVADLGGVTWRGLRVIDAPAPDGDTGTVTFVASFITDDGERGEVREHSRFARRAGRWFYVDGDELGRDGLG